MKATNEYTYKNGMTTKGISKPNVIQDFMAKGFQGLDSNEQFLKGSLQANAQAALRACMQKKQDFSDILEAMEEENHNFIVGHVIACNISYALSIPSHDWNELFSYATEICDEAEFDYVDFSELLKELCTYNLANTYALILGATSGRRLDSLMNHLGYYEEKDTAIMCLSVLFDDERTTSQIMKRFDSNLVATAQLDKVMSRFKFDPFSKIRADRAAPGGVSNGEMYERVTNQIAAIRTGQNNQSKLTGKTPSRQYRMAPESKPPKVMCPITDIVYIRPSTGLLREEDLQVSGMNHKVELLPQYPKFMNHFKHDISLAIGSAVMEENEVIPKEASEILAGLVVALDTNGMPLKEFFLRNFAKMTPGAIMDICNDSNYTHDAYLKSLLGYNTLEDHDRKFRSKTDFLILAEGAEIFKDLILSDTHLKVLHDRFNDKFFLELMSDSGIERQLGMDIGL